MERPVFSAHFVKDYSLFSCSRLFVCFGLKDKVVVIISLHVNKQQKDSQKVLMGYACVKQVPVSDTGTHARSHTHTHTLTQTHTGCFDMWSRVKWRSSHAPCPFWWTWTSPKGPSTNRQDTHAHSRTHIHTTTILWCHHKLSHKHTHTHTHTHTLWGSS